ncbi:flagellar hook-length control protein FliK [Pseudoroseicyclus aestuarii]|nr:flagellar hook-length control protein FliK [Pseudoroseicyclus aestuarii]
MARLPASEAAPDPAAAPDGFAALLALTPQTGPAPQAPPAPAPAEVLAETIAALREVIEARLEQAESPEEAAVIAGQGQARLATLLQDFDAVHGTAFAALLQEEAALQEGADPQDGLPALFDRAGALLTEPAQPADLAGPAPAGHMAVPPLPGPRPSAQWSIEAPLHPGSGVPARAEPKPSAQPDLALQAPTAVEQLSASPPQAAAPQSLPLQAQPLQTQPLQALSQPPAAAQPPHPPEAPPIPTQIAEPLRRLSHEEERTRVELMPKGLGSIEIEVHRAEDGRLQVVLRADNSATLAALRGDREGLLGALGQSGITDADLGFGSFSDPRRGGQTRREASPRDAAPLPFAGAAPLTPEAPASAPRTTAGRIDIIT